MYIVTCDIITLYFILLTVLHPLIFRALKCSNLHLYILRGSQRWFLDESKINGTGKYGRHTSET